MFNDNSKFPKNSKYIIENISWVETTKKLGRATKSVINIHITFPISNFQV